MKKIEAQDSQQVTFSKRRIGIFKKASELSILCGAHTAIIVYSLAGKVYSFGQPSVASVVDNFLAKRPYNDLVAAGEAKGHQPALQQYNEALDQLRAAKNNIEQVLTLKKASQQNHQVSWWEGPIENLGLHELEQLQASLAQLKLKIAIQGDELINDCMQSPQNLNHNV